MDFRGLVWKRVWKITFFCCEIGSGFEEPGATPPPRIPRSNPPPLPGTYYLSITNCIWLLSTGILLLKTRRCYYSFTRYKQYNAKHRTIMPVYACTTPPRVASAFCLSLFLHIKRMWNHRFIGRIAFTEKQYYKITCIWYDLIKSAYRTYSASEPIALKAITAAMNEWSSKTCITFKKRTTEKDYVEFFKGKG